MSLCVSNIKAMAPSSSSDSSSAAAAATADDDDADVVVAELEMDELNQHECMSSLISVLRHMQINSITPAVEQVTASVCMDISLQTICICLISRYSTNDRLI